MSKHTRGDWRVEENYADDRIVVCSPWTTDNRPQDADGYGSSIGIHVCELHHQNDNPCVSKEQALDNAYLIAAAPKLFKVLEDVIPYLQNLHFDDIEKEKLLKFNIESCQRAIDKSKRKEIE